MEERRTQFFLISHRDISLGKNLSIWEKGNGAGNLKKTLG